MIFADGREESGTYYYYFQLSNHLRSTCYSCRRVYHEIADLTIDDFGGIHAYRLENEDYI